MTKPGPTLHLRPNGPLAGGPWDFRAVALGGWLALLAFAVILTLVPLPPNGGPPWLVRGLLWAVGITTGILMVLEFLVSPTATVNEEGVWLRQGRFPSKSLPWGRVERVMYGTNILAGVRLLPRPRARDSGYFIQFVDRKGSRSFGVGELTEGVSRIVLEAWVAKALEFARLRGIPVIEVLDRGGE